MFLCAYSLRVRNFPGFGDIEPKEGTFDFKDVDLFVGNATEVGIEVTAILAYVTDSKILCHRLVK